jgi:hypothetical protein
MQGDAMNQTPDYVTAGNGGNFDPQQAAALLAQTTHRARRQLEPYPPWLLAVVVAVVGAVGLLAGPAGAWGVDAVGVCAVLLANAAIGARQQRS